MKISFWITAGVLFCTVRFVLPNNLQVGTVLFTTTDIVKKCWTESDKALLRARLIMQDVLPQPDCINFSKPGVVAILLDYFQSCYEIISLSTSGKTQNLMFLALSDAVGGYLRAYILPISKRAYYAGQVDYSETSKLFQLYNDIKMFLKTNGVGWAKPYKLGPLQTMPKPLVIPTTDGTTACDNLYIIERKTKFHFNRPQKIRKFPFVKTLARFEDKTRQTTPCPEHHPLANDEGPTNNELLHLKSILLSNATDKTTTQAPFKNYGQLSMKTTTVSDVKSGPEFKDRRESVTNRKVRRKLHRRRSVESKERDASGSCTNESQSDGSEDRLPYVKRDNTLMGCLVTFPDEQQGKKVSIPLPVLDNSNTPFTIAVPFKSQPLRSLRDRSSAFVLEHYYTSVIKCMISRGSSKGDIKQFNGQFFSWLCSEVYPHLGDEVWYPAFGGVLRITETIKKLGADASIKDPCLNDVGYMFPNKFAFDDSPQRTGKEKTRDVGDVGFDDEHTQSKRLITYGIIVLAIMSLFIFWVCISCMQSLKTKKTYRPPIRMHYGSTKKPKRDGSRTDHRKKKDVCYDGILMNKAEKKRLKKAEKKARRERAKQIKREKKKLKRVPDFKEMTYVHKGGGDRLPLFKLPWTFAQKKNQEKMIRRDITDGESSSKCLVHHSSVPTWLSSSPFIALQNLGSRLNVSNMETSTPVSTDVNRATKTFRNPLDKIQLIWKKPSDKSTKTYYDKETQDTEHLRKTSMESTLESSKKDKVLGTLPSDSYTFSVEDEGGRHRVKKRCTSQDRSDTCLMSSGTTTSPSSENSEASSAESETDDSYSCDSDSSRQTTDYK